MMKLHRSITQGSLVALLLLLGCGAADDDDSTGDDDDSALADDDDDDTTVADDDDDDDTGPGQDYTSATVPDFADCSGNQVKVMLGDGTVLEASSGDPAVPDSFANVNSSFRIKVGGAGGVGDWAMISGNRTGMAAGVDIPLQGPASVEGNAVLAAFVDAAGAGGAPAATTGAFGMPTANADPAVGGTVTFDSLPEPGVLITGSFSAILQSQQQLLAGNVVLLGVSGCFAATLEATDG